MPLGASPQACGGCRYVDSSSWFFLSLLVVWGSVPPAAKELFEKSSLESQKLYNKINVFELISNRIIEL
jgi:hypothetical protein